MFFAELATGCLELAGFALHCGGCTSDRGVCVGRLGLHAWRWWLDVFHNLDGLLLPFGTNSVVFFSQS